MRLPKQSWTETMLWNLFQCYLSGQHDFGVRCEPGEIYLRCIHCGRRSAGWALSASEQKAREEAAAAKHRGTAAKPPARAAAPVVASV
jgi:hypothetical protein